MQIETIRFGTVEIDDTKLIVFDEGVPGLEEYHNYALLQFEETYPIMWLQSVEEGGICLPVLNTYAVLSGYVFDIVDEDATELELKGPEELLVVSVLVIPEDIQGMTANLAAPIIINLVSGKARQIMLTGSDYNVRAPVYMDICKMLKREEGDGDAGTVTETE